MKTIEEVVAYAKKHGFDEDSRVLNVTHIDLDGIVATINLKNYIKNPNNFYYVQYNYDKINEFFRNVLFKNNCVFKKPEWVVVTDISLEEDVVEECRKQDFKLLILDHHATAFNLNKYEECYVDKSGTLSGAGVTLEFIKGLGYTNTKLDKLNVIANQFDLFLFKNEQCRKFDIHGKKRSLAEMLNNLYFKDFERDAFIERWYDGWGKGFTAEEVHFIKQQYKDASEHIEMVKNSKLKVDLDDNKVLILNGKHVVSIGEYFLDDLGKDLVITYDAEKQKFSGRVNDEANIDIGKIFKVMKEKCSYVKTGGGHEKAGGGTLSSNDHLDEFVEKMMKLVNYYE